ncbi:UDP-N-acetylhexosamine pyrophosphorylase isoform X2 [Diabrotica virgifera virgifera]|uniref:UDP-N-acetylglucosamine diphosphorylase n=1 Tax=Diabrotica virgifera virgifera TaxID=50390 RepID=A0ABM5K7B7_DIAVI|nr:UDP-N-acetylhexosamine pyrophosphorylase isoform X2 [Diabrotica virgifera virgifera]
MATITELRAILERNGQSHLIQFWDKLTNEEQDVFVDQLNTINFGEANQLFKNAMLSLNDQGTKLDSKMKPVPAHTFESEEEVNSDVLAQYKKIGLEEIANGHVAVLLMAGGQGTRLGVNYPKGMYSVGLPSSKTLFQIQAERIRKVMSLAKQQTGHSGRIVWYIMTSGPTDETTEKFLRKHDYFGLDKKDVVLFKQGLLPCFDFNGKIFLESNRSVALAPDGNGGIYRALQKNGILDDMKKRGIKYLHAHSVDNILVKVADPVFIGYCVKKEAECGAKVVKKSGPNEAIGVVCQIDGKFQVVEYSEITEKTANLRDSDGNLVFSSGNICNHFFTTDFLNKIANSFESQLKLHVAKKKIPHVNSEGEKISPTSPNGIKIEKFVFDVFQFTNNFVTWEVPRSSEFSALKNADNKEGTAVDCPSTSKRDLLRLHKKYIENAGGKVTSNEVEISPLLSYAGENLEIRVKGKVFDKTTVIYSDEEQLIMNNNNTIDGPIISNGQISYLHKNILE